MTTAILGASDKSERYSYRALRMLREHGYDVIPVHPSLEEIDGIPVVARLEQVEEPVDTLTIYLRPERCEPLTDSITDLRPRRVIFNPGTESDALSSTLAEAGIEVENACTLVLLRSGQY